MRLAALANYHKIKTGHKIEKFVKRFSDNIDFPEYSMFEIFYKCLDCLYEWHSDISITKDFHNKEIMLIEKEVENGNT
jgi:hypothetical protein